MSPFLTEACCYFGGKHAFSGPSLAINQEGTSKGAKNVALDLQQKVIYLATQYPLHCTFVSPCTIHPRVQGIFWHFRDK